MADSPNSPLFDTPQQAEQAFYQSFAARDLEAMMAVWEESEAIICIHPMGLRCQGPEEIRASWQQIMEHSPELKIQLGEQRVVQKGELAIHQVAEQILRLDNGQQMTMLATNIYRRTTEGGWRMILHHASATPSTERREPAPAAPFVLH